MNLFVDIRKRLGSFTLNASFETADAVTGLLGASGCGKSMTLKCIAGVEKPDEGWIVLDGETLFDSARSIRPAAAKTAGWLSVPALCPASPYDGGKKHPVRPARGKG